MAPTGSLTPALTTSPFCGRCGSGIVGRYVRALNSDWHPEHFLCGACGIPIDGGFVEKGNIAYHRPCHVDLFASRCFYCGEPMGGVYIRNAWGTEFCQFHTEELIPCVFCGRLVDGSKITGRETKAGLHCSVCRETAVDTPEDAASVYDRIVRWAADRALLIPAVPLRLTDWQTLMSNLSEPRGRHPLGSTHISTVTSSGMTVRIDVLHIAVLRALPRILFSAVVAHEVGHAWLRTTGADGLSPAEEEGFCELLAYKWLREESSPERDFYAERIANNDDAVYGDGFRHVRGICTSCGFSGVIDSLRQAKRLPLPEIPC